MLDQPGWAFAELFWLVCTLPYEIDPQLHEALIRKTAPLYAAFLVAVKADGTALLVSNSQQRRRPKHSHLLRPAWALRPLEQSPPW